MKKILLVWMLALACMVSASGGQKWEETLSPIQAGSFPPMPPLTAHYKFGWGAFSAAEADFDMRYVNRGLIRLGVKAKSTGFPRTLWKLDAEHVALTRAVTFRPVTATQVEMYDKETRKTRLDFSSAGVVCTQEVKGSDENTSKVKRWKYPNVLDLHGTLHWVRSQPLKTGDTYRLVVYPAGTPYLAEAKVLPRASRTIGGTKRDTIPIAVKLWKIDDDDLELKPYTKFSKATLWVGDDKHRMLLRVEAEIFVGSFWAELSRVSFVER